MNVSHTSLKDSSAAAIEHAPSWTSVEDWDALMDHIERQTDLATREKIELLVEDWDALMDPDAFDHRVRVWPNAQRIDTSSTAYDQDAMNAPLETSWMGTHDAEAQQNGRYLKFENAASANEALLAHGSKLYFWVDSYQHGNTMLSVSGTVAACDFDTARQAGLYIPPDDQQAAYRALLKTTAPLEARRTFVDAANRALSHYSQWLNGEVFSVEVRRLEFQSGRIDSEQGYGIVGLDEVEATRDDLWPVPSLAPGGPNVEPIAPVRTRQPI